VLDQRDVLGLLEEGGGDGLVRGQLLVDDLDDDELLEPPGPRCSAR
jgi:hypothetical protein